MVQWAVHPCHGSLTVYPSSACPPLCTSPLPHGPAHTPYRPYPGNTHAHGRHSHGHGCDHGIVGTRAHDCAHGYDWMTCASVENQLCVLLVYHPSLGYPAAYFRHEICRGLHYVFCESRCGFYDVYDVYYHLDRDACHFLSICRVHACDHHLLSLSRCHVHSDHPCCAPRFP